MSKKKCHFCIKFENPGFPIRDVSLCEWLQNLWRNLMPSSTNIFIPNCRMKVVLS